MTDDDALVALALGNESEQASAREHLADVYIAKLMVIFRRLLPEDIADQAVSGAIMRLIRVAKETPERLPSPVGLESWLVRGGWFEARDAQRRVRGRQRATVEGLDGHEEDLESRSTESDETVDNAGGAELARVTLQYIFALEQPARGILLYDTYKCIQELTNEELDFHDEELIDCVKPYGVWTRNALRSHRTRARRDLLEHLIERGFSL